MSLIPFTIKLDTAAKLENESRSRLGYFWFMLFATSEIKILCSFRNAGKLSAGTYCSNDWPKLWTQFWSNLASMLWIS